MLITDFPPIPENTKAWHIDHYNELQEGVITWTRADNNFITGMYFKCETCGFPLYSRMINETVFLSEQEALEKTK
jgi:hypothetical protein